MNIVNPIDFLRRFAWCDLQIDYDRFVPATHNYAAKRLLSAGVDLLVWGKGRHINEIARTGVLYQVFGALSSDHHTD
jgi:hypothetical protein